MGLSDSALRGRVVFVDGRPEHAAWAVGVLTAHPRVLATPAPFDVFEQGVHRLFDNVEGRHPTLHGLIRFADREQLVELVRTLCDGILLAACAPARDPAAVERLVVPVATGRRAHPLQLQRRRDCFPDAWHLDAGAGDLRDARRAAHELFARAGLDAADAALGAIPPVPRLAAAAGAARAVPGRLARRAGAELRRLASPRRADPGAELVFSLMVGLHHRDATLLRSLAHPDLELVVRAGAPAHRALADLAEDLFGRRHVGEWWAAAGGSGDWWTAAPGRPFRSLFFSGVGGDATRIDVALAIEPDGGAIRRLTVMPSGPFAGRPIARIAPGA